MGRVEAEYCQDSMNTDIRTATVAGGGTSAAGNNAAGALGGHVVEVGAVDSGRSVGERVARYNELMGLLREERSCTAAGKYFREAFGLQKEGVGVVAEDRRLMRMDYVKTLEDCMLEQNIKTETVEMYANMLVAHIVEVYHEMLEGDQRELFAKLSSTLVNLGRGHEIAKYVAQLKEARKA